MEPLEFFVMNEQGIKHPIKLHPQDNVIEILNVELGVSFAIGAWDDALSELGIGIVDMEDTPYTVDEFFTAWEKKNA